MAEGSTASPRVLVVTGGYLTEKENSIVQSARKLLLQSRASRHAWLDFKIKLNVVELLIKSSIQALREKLSGGGRARLAAHYTAGGGMSAPDLTEVVLTTLLEKEGIPFLATTYHDLFANPAWAEEALETTDCVLASTTLLHDMSELGPAVEFMNRDHNRIVLGGALVSSLGQSWPGCHSVDLVAIGYGEFLVPTVADWIRSGYRELEAPDGGRLDTVNNTPFVYAGLPAGENLDMLDRPDWAATFRRHDQVYGTIYYESVRGCPFRCSFCNYPYLFDDTKFRYKSAQKIAADWQSYKEDLGIDLIVCLDSLFTVPKARVRKLCELLVQRDVQLHWVCYARADDLADEALVRLLKQAGLSQVQIGVESADQDMLDNMNKRCKAEDAGKAIENCRKHGITTVISLIVGYPGETADTLETTYNFLRNYPPDFYYLATFSTRIENVPVLWPESRQRFGLESFSGYLTGAPYWKHDTMDCGEAVNHVRRLNQSIMENRVSLNGMVFFPGMYAYDPRDREALLDYQYRLARGYRGISWAASRLHRYIDNRLSADFDEYIAVERL